MAREPMNLIQSIKKFSARQQFALNSTFCEELLAEIQPNRRGFTLLEMLIALVIIAVVGLTISSAVGNVTAQTYTLERRLVAHWVAENHLARVQLARIGTVDAVPTGRETERVRMSARNWRIEREIMETTHPWLRRVEIKIYEVTDDEDIGPLDTFVGFLGRY